MTNFYKHITIKTLLIFCYHFICIASSDLNFCSNMLKFLNNTDQMNKFIINKYSRAWVKGKNSSIACCAPEGYDIKWLFNNKDLTNSSFRVAELDPRYILTQNVSRDDKGEYTCVANSKEDSNKRIKASTELTILRYDNIRKPWEAEIPEDRMAYPGDKNVSFVCGAFLGFNPSRLNHIKIHWELAYNITEPFKNKELPLKKEWGCMSTVTDCFGDSREGQKSPQPPPWSNPCKDYVVRTYLVSVGGQVLAYTSFIIPEVTLAMLDSDLNVTCVFTNTETNESLRIMKYLVKDDIPDFGPWRVLTGLLSTFLVSLLIIALIVLKYHVEIRLYWKDRFGSIEGMCVHDAYVCFSSDTRCLVHCTLVPYLEEKLGYSCYYFERDALGGEYLPATQPKMVRASRRFVVVLSAEMLRDVICKETCIAALNEALSRKLTIVCVQPPKKETKSLLANVELNEALEKILSVSKKVTWPGENTPPRRLRRFWNELRLHLPPLRNKESHLYRDNLALKGTSADLEQNFPLNNNMNKKK